MKEVIIIYKGSKFTSWVDDDDYNMVVLNGPWYMTGMGYAYNKTMPMHDLIMGPPPGMMVDHINRIKLDNRRSNLRICTKSQNLCNRGVQRNNLSGFKGVSQHPNGRWFARIQLNGKQKTLGFFSTAEDAAHAYDKAALEIHGEFALINFPK